MTGLVRPLAAALKGKGLSALPKRAWLLGKRYGLTTARMDRSLGQLSELLEAFQAGATLPITAVVLARNSSIIRKYQGQGIEFLVHGYTHIDYSQLTPEEQLAHLRRAREIFAKAGIRAQGFRSPYLRGNTHLDTALEAAGFSYVSSQPIMWDVLGLGDFGPTAHARFNRAVGYYRPWLASERPSLPHLRRQLVEIPVSLPDDEMLVDRLGGKTRGLAEKAWRHILSQTHQWGELFTIQLHPERMTLCVDALSAVLAEARALAPPVWLARLDEVAAWWRDRAAATLEMREDRDGEWHLSVVGPPGVSILARGVEILGFAEPWADDYWQVASTSCVVRAARRPFIGISPACPLALRSFLRQQGYIHQVSNEDRCYSVYLDRADFAPEDERPLLAEIEEGAAPLVRLGRWPNGTYSAVCVTGDIDALTLWDYGLRLLGK